MRVLIYGVTENTTIRGVERYILETVKHVASMNPGWSFVVLCGRWQLGYMCSLKSYENVVLRCISCPNNKILRHLHVIFSVAWSGRSFSIVHLMNTLPVVWKCSPTVVTIHDVAEYFVPNKYGALQRIYRKAISRLAAKKSDKVLTVSDFSADVISKRFGVERNKIVTTYNGASHLVGTKTCIKKGGRENGDVLYVGALERSKGVDVALKAFVKAKDKSLIPCAVKFNIIGKKANAYKDISDYLSRDDVIYKGEVSDEDLSKIYQESFVFIFVSKYEGFGLPVLEAFLCGCNVICSNTTSLGEISREFAVQVNPYSDTEVEEALVDIYSKESSCRLPEKQSIYEKFSWGKTASIVSSAYMEFVVERG